MNRWRHGLVIGKFRPPHKGHGLLIRTALEQVDRLTMLVCADGSDTVPVDLRAGWLRELFPAADVRVVETTGRDAEDSPLWAELTRGWLGAAPDVIFTSEGYGEPYARALGCAHVAVDPDRRQVPISASRILARPLAHLEYLDPPVRAHFVARVALVGAESTGKTTLAAALARRYRTTWVPEYGRTYWDGLLTRGAIGCATADFLHIAEAQARMEDMLARHADGVLFCDTDPFCTWLWHERYMGCDCAPLRETAFSRRYALYVLCGDEIAWHDDGTRERAHERPRFQSRFRDELGRLGRPWIEVAGPLGERIDRASAAVDRLLAEGGAAPEQLA
jgi:HTH-type transcriptional repressor of NAD biosynthesis genes